MPLDKENFRAEEMAPAGTQEEFESKGSVMIKESDLPSLKGMEPGDSIEFTLEATVESMHADEEDASYLLAIRRLSPMEDSLEQARARAVKEAGEV